jgi:NhaP-type Na+/H+ or K+/H+ antiporter
MSIPSAHLHFDAHTFFFIGSGLLAIVVAWLPLYLSRLPLSLPMICLALGLLALGIPGVFLRESYDRLFLLEHLNEAVLVIAVLGAGLSLDRRIGWRRWASTWRLLGIAMPLSFAATFWLAWRFGHFSLASAALIGAILTPTDPVLAGDLTVGPPGTGEEGEARQALTSEAGLNDGLAAPFVLFAIALERGTRIGAGWLAEHLLWKVCLAIVLGLSLGRAFGWFQFKVPGIRDAPTADGLAAVGLAFLVYGATESLGGYGFVAVFLAALRLRGTAPQDEVHKRMVEFTGQLEHLIAMLIIVLFAAAVSRGLLSALTWRDVALAAALLLAIRPLSGFLSLLGTPHPFISRATTAFFGIRGIGTLYYLMYALRAAAFSEQPRLIAVAGTTVLASIILHGSAATPVMRRLDRMRTTAVQRRSAAEGSND